MVHFMLYFSFLQNLKVSHFDPKLYFLFTWQKRTQCCKLLPSQSEMLHLWAHTDRRFKWVASSGALFSLLHVWLSPIAGDSSGTCGDPGTPAHASREVGNFKVRSKVRFTCAVGHTLYGSAERICFPNGTWSGKQPFCKRKANLQHVFEMFWFKRCVRSVLESSRTSNTRISSNTSAHLNSCTQRHIVALKAGHWMLMVYIDWKIPIALDIISCLVSKALRDRSDSQCCLFIDRLIMSSGFLSLIWRLALWQDFYP